MIWFALEPMCSDNRISRLVQCYYRAGLPTDRILSRGYRGQRLEVTFYLAFMFNKAAAGVVQADGASIRP